MSKPKTLAALGYGALAVTDTLLAGSTSRNARRLRRITKPLLMPALAFGFAESTQGRTDLLRRGTLAAQTFSWGGDIALLGTGERSLLAGVGSFFAAHVSYIAAFSSVGRARREGAGIAPGSRGGRAGGFGNPGLKVAAGLWAVTSPVMVLAAGRKDPRFRIPIAAYGTVLAAMFATSTRLASQADHRPAGREVVAGTALFLVSDTLLGLREFILDDPHPRLDAVVMATYTAGQGLIAAGAGRLAAPADPVLLSARDPRR